MKLEFSIDAAKMEGLIEQKVESVKLHVAEAMTATAYDIVMRNFGPTGVDRPLPWAPLSNRAPYFYAAKVGRPFATLRVTGAMEQAVRHNVTTDGGKVSLSDDDCSYATKHHFGTDILPIRRVFPINLDETVTDYTQNAVIEAAATALEAELR